MAKTKSIKDRPMIIVSTSATKWGVEFLKEQIINANVGSVLTPTNTIVLVNPNKTLPDYENSPTTHKIAAVKDETANSGVFTISTDDCFWKYITPKGQVYTGYQLRTSNINYTFSSLKQCVDFLQAHTGLVKNYPNLKIRRIANSYYNQKTKEATKSLEVAKTWFKDKDPMFISSAQYQQIGVWVDGGPDYVTISYYYCDRIQRTDCGKWEKAKVGGFRLYNDGSISHFYKGNTYSNDGDREYCTERVFYRSFDARFRESSRLMTCALDLRSKDLSILSPVLCPETKKILKKAGFPTEYWCWKDYKRPFNDTYDLVNFARFIQNKNPTKRGSSIADFLADKPFSAECQKVLQFNNGLIIRIPGLRQTWKCKGKEYNYKPGIYRDGILEDDEIRLEKVEIYERYRIWVSNNGKTRSCQEIVHDGKVWNQCQWSSMSWPDPNRESADTFNGIEKADNSYDITRQNAVFALFKRAAIEGYSQILNEFPMCNRIKDFINAHSDLKTAQGVRALLDAFYYAPKLTETLIKTGRGDWFYHGIRDYRYYGYPNDKGFMIDNVLERFGIRSPSKYKAEAKSSSNMYKNLGITKEQFSWINSFVEGPIFMNNFRDAGIPIPGKSHSAPLTVEPVNCYQNFMDIPVKYLEMIKKAVDGVAQSERASSFGSRQDISDYWEGCRRISRLLSAFKLDPVEINKALARNLNLRMLEDYLRLRSQCDGHNNFRAADWPSVPSDPTDLRFSHDRLCEFHDLIMAEQERYYRQEREKQLIECQKKYDDRYKKLKKLAYEKEDEEKVIVVPEKLIELVIEGQTLHHCVGSFTESVSAGRDTIVFLRDKKTPQTPYATINLLQNGDGWRVDQAHTAHNGPISDEDVTFLKHWGKENKVDLSTITTRYGAKCHH